MTRYRLAMPEERVPIAPKIREPIKALLDESLNELGDTRGMQQWFIEAAILHFYEAGLDKQMEYIRRVRDADMEGGTRGLVGEIKAKREPTTRGKRDPQS